MSEKIKTIKDILDYCAEKFGRYTAFQIKIDDKYLRITFSEVFKKARSLGTSLKEMGVGFGDRVALLSENRPEWPISYLAIANIGAIVVPLDPLSKTEDLEPIINHSGAKAIITSEKYLSEVKTSKKKLPDIHFVISMDLKENTQDVLSFEKLSGGDKQPTNIKFTEEDLAAIVYTSGTTGIPKGVMLSHKNIVSNVLAVAKLFDIGPSDNFLSVLPLYHTFETTCGFLGPFYLGAKITYAESMKSYNLLRNMQETGVTIMCGVPLLYSLFYDGIIREVEEKGVFVKTLFSLLAGLAKASKAMKINLGRKLFSMVHKKLGGKIRFWVSGAAAINPEVIKGFGEMGITILQGYGLTEASPILSCCTLKENKVGSVGKALPGVTIKIMNPDKYGYGEIIAKGSNIMRGYYKRDDATSETLRDGWLYTGDIGYLDKDGNLYITGRSKDVIVSDAGINVYPDEVEFVINKSPFIKESCVIGKKYEEGVRRGGEQVYAVVLPDMEYFEKFGKEKNVIIDSNFIDRTIALEIRKYCDILPEYKRVASYEIREVDFPKTSTKKIKRYAVRKELGLV